MADTTVNLIEHWKRNAPRPEEQIPFASIMSSLGTPFSIVEFKEETVGRWIVRIRRRDRQAAANSTLVSSPRRAEGRRVFFCWRGSVC